MLATPGLVGPLGRPAACRSGSRWRAGRARHVAAADPTVTAHANSTALRRWRFMARSGRDGTPIHGSTRRSGGPRRAGDGRVPRHRAGDRAGARRRRRRRRGELPRARPERRGGRRRGPGERPSRPGHRRRRVRRPGGGGDGPLGGSGARAGGRAGQQRRGGDPARPGRADGGGVRPHAGGEPEGRLPVRAGGAARHARAALGPHRQHLLRGGARRRRHRRALQRVQGRARGAHPRLRRARSPRTASPSTRFRRRSSKPR